MMEEARKEKKKGTHGRSHDAVPDPMYRPEHHEKENSTVCNAEERRQNGLTGLNR